MREALALLIPACAIGFFLFPVLPAPAGLTRLRQRRVAVRPDETVSADARHAVSAIALAICLGIGFSSVTSAAFVAIGIAPASGGFVLADVAIWGSVAALGWWTRRRWSRPVRARSRLTATEPGTRGLNTGELWSKRPEPGAGNPASHDRIDWILRAAFGVTATIALVSVITSLRAMPHGDWDAWAIWNQHARFLFRGGGSDTWQAFLAITWSQPDYPLLLPASVARVWAFAGYESVLGPALIAMAFGAASVALVVTTLDGRRAWIAGALILGAHTFLTQVPSQCADVPLACFIVATFAVTFGDALTPQLACVGGLSADPAHRNRRHHQGSALPASPTQASSGGSGPDSGSRVPFLVAGATSAMAAWTKNEGLVFALLMLVLAAAAAGRDLASAGDRPRRPAGRQLLWGIAGGAPVVIALVWFKLALAPASGLAEGLSFDVLVTRLFDLQRHATVAVLMAQHAMRWSASFAVAVFPLAGLAAIWMAIQKGDAVRAMTAVLGLMLVSYYFVYVTTPFDISWHVSSSLDRLLIQLWPALVLAVFFSPRSSRALPAREVRQETLR
jgi:hypothetical protein